MNRVNISMAKVVIAVFAIAITTLAGTVQMISYQGFLSDTENQPVTGDRQMVFTIYDAPQNGSTLWSSGQVQIHVEDGIFSYLIGEDPSLPPGCFADTGRWLGIQVLPDSEMTPRTPLTSVPYSHQALNADTAEVGGGWTKEDLQRGTILRPTSDETRVAIGPEVFSGKATSAALCVNAMGADYLQLGDSTLFVGGDGLVTLKGRGVKIQNSDLGISVNWEWSDDITIESADAVIGLYSSPDANFGSAISLSEISTDSMLTDKWAILRETDGGPLGGSGLRFTYGTEKNQAINSTFMRINRTGNIGVGALDPGEYKLYVESSGSGHQAATLCVKNTQPLGGYAVKCENNSSAPALWLQNKGDGDMLKCYDGSSMAVFSVNNDGEVTCSVLKLTGGNDIVEPFEISGDKELEKGAVVVIDENNPGKLKLSDRAYDTRVAGIISGAGGLNPGIMLTQDDSFSRGQNVAISGRVYCNVDASYGSIRPGDLLTTSATAGYAMKATSREQSYGAVIGKAMTGLEEGQGQILVLVNLQ